MGIFKMVEDGVGYIVLSNGKYNLVDGPNMELFRRLVKELDEDEDVFVVVLMSDEEYFTAGMDLKYRASLNRSGRYGFLKLGGETLKELSELSKPLVCVIEGDALGLGVELLLCADIVLAKKDIKLSLPEIKHGFIPPWGGVHRLIEAIGEARAKKMLFLGETITGIEAFDMGLVTQLIEDRHEVEIVAEKLKKYSKKYPHIYDLTKNFIRVYQNRPDIAVMAESINFARAYREGNVE